MVLVTLVVGLPCAGQMVNATLTGTVKDSSGAVVPQAVVKVTDLSTGVTTTTTSDSAGNYIFPSLAPATYTLSAERSGFRTTVITGITLAVYGKSTMDVELRVGEVTQTGRG